jgi:hypothetical protein
MHVIEYHKIPGPFKRATDGPNKNKVIAWKWTSKELEVLKDVPWIFTEKIDGTNIRVVWDGHKPEFRGRTDNAQLHPQLITALQEMFPEELLEQTFGANPAILFGEGYGAGIQKGGGNYRKDKSFILFDVFIGGWWLERHSVEDIAGALGIDVVPIYFEDSLTNVINVMSKTDMLSITAEAEDFSIEGLVGTPATPLFNRKGERVIVKLKGCDLYGLDLDNPIVTE